MKINPPDKSLFALEGRAFFEFLFYLAANPFFQSLPSGDGHTVLVLPGFGTNDYSTYFMRRFLTKRGYDAKSWKLGVNMGPRNGIESDLKVRLEDLYQRNNKKVSLIGWSLGGLYARELAKTCPDLVRSVITLGTPIHQLQTATNVNWIYELSTGEMISELDDTLLDGFKVSPPVPTTSIFSTNDGVVAWRSCVQRPEPHTENIQISGSHCGLIFNTKALYVIADRLSQPENKWVPFKSNLPD